MHMGYNSIIEQLHVMWGFQGGENDVLGTDTLYTRR
jgi:hypothetical protein